MLHLFLLELLIQIKSSQTSEVVNGFSSEYHNEDVILSFYFKEDSISLPQKQDATTSKDPTTVENNKLVAVENVCVSESFDSTENNMYVFISDKNESKKRNSGSESKTLQDLQNPGSSSAKKIQPSENFSNLLDHIETAKTTIGHLRECLINFLDFKKQTEKEDFENSYFEYIEKHIEILTNWGVFFKFLQIECDLILEGCNHEQKADKQAHESHEVENPA